ncbi:cinnamoyl-CoA reductase 2-like [Wolffia australiana]
MAGEKRVCVTGAGGFAASWLVKLLLSKGFVVHGTVRDPSDPKNAHLKNLENAENLKLFKADLLDYYSLMSAIDGCEGVFHTACPVPPGQVKNPEVEMIAPALDGTLNVLKACSEAKVKRFVMVSSVVAVYMDPDSHSGRVLDERDWSSEEYCKSTGNWYCYSKTIAEKKAFEYAKERGLHLVTICPALIIGPLLQPTINASSLLIIRTINGERETAMSRMEMFIDVRDLADAMLLIYEKTEAKGRYICSSFSMRTKDFVDKLKSMYPNFKYPKSFTGVGNESNLSSEKLKQLGWVARTLEETISDTVEHLLENGIVKMN